MSEDELLEEWYKLGLANQFIRAATDPPFTRESFTKCNSYVELRDKLSHGNWSTGTAFYMRDLCLINQVDGGDEWLTIRHGIAFESISFLPIIERGEYAPLLVRLFAATKDMCQRLEY